MKDTRYKIGEIALDEEGIWWVKCYQNIAEQGGSRFGYGCLGLYSLEDAMEMLRYQLDKHKDTLQDKIGGRGK